MTRLRLTQFEQQILARVEFSPNISAENLAKELSVKTPSVHYAIRKLKDSEVIQQRAFINPTRLGYFEVSVYFSLVDQAHIQREKILSRITKHSQVVFLGGLLGDYHYLLLFLSKRVEDIPKFMLEVFQGIGDVFSEKLIAPRVGFYRFRKKYLDPSMPIDKPLSFESDSSLIEIDALDSRILHEIVHNGFDSIRQVARDLGTPLTTIDRRIERMLKNGLVSGFYYAINQEMLGVRSYRLLVMKKGFCETTRKRVFDFCSKHINVTYLIEAVGAWDFEIGLETNEQEDVVRCVEALYAECGLRIAWVKTLLEGKSYTCSLYPFNKIAKRINK